MRFTLPGVLNKQKETVNISTDRFQASAYTEKSATHRDPNFIKSQHQLRSLTDR